jgi:hypothetical protein
LGLAVDSADIRTGDNVDLFRGINGDDRKFIAGDGRGNHAVIAMRDTVTRGEDQDRTLA